MVFSTTVLPLPWVHRSRIAADTRRVRRVGARIFAELLPQITAHLATRRAPAAMSAAGPAFLWARPQGDAPARGVPPPRPVMPAEKSPRRLHAYRTESPYYFSSRQLMAAGTLVFFSDTLRRYVHPTAGVLFDPHPRLAAVSEAESQRLAAQWREALAHYSA